MKANADRDDTLTSCDDTKILYCTMYGILVPNLSNLFISKRENEFLQTVIINFNESEKNSSGSEIRRNSEFSAT